MNQEREQYTMGYGPAATAIMAMRTAQTHATFFLPHLRPGMSVLDCGCGPGTITAGFAELVAPGEVVGTEIEELQVIIARQNAAKHGGRKLRFEIADLYELPFADSSFDAVFISAVLGNLREPIRGLGEALRVLKPGGVIGVKEFDHGGDLIFPNDPALEQYGELYLRLRKKNGHDPEIGRKIGALLLNAGFVDLKLSPSYESFSNPMAAGVFARLSAQLLGEGWGETFISNGWASKAEITKMETVWNRFANVPGAMFAAAWCEAIARKRD